MSDTNNPNNFEFPFQKKHINACSGVEELLPLWKLAHKCEVNTDYITGNVPGYAFLPDGIINEESFAKSSPRILFIAKKLIGMVNTMMIKRLLKMLKLLCFGIAG